MISIIVPIYNAENTLVRCIDSLIKQTYKNIEIILVNDGSTDLSENIAKRYTDKHSYIQYFSQMNKGVSAARNLGLSRARGEYIIFMDADDWAEPEYIQSLYTRIETDNSGFVFSNWYVDDGDTKVKDSLERYGYKYNQSSSSLIRFYILHRSGCAPWAKMYRKDIIQKYNLRFNEELPIAEDYVFLLNYLIYVDTVSYDCSTYLHYIYNNTGANYKIRNNYPELQEIVFKELGRINDLTCGKFEEDFLLATMIYNCRIILYLSKIRSQRLDWKVVLAQKSSVIRKLVKKTCISKVLKLGRNELLIAVFSLLYLDVLLQLIIFIKSKMGD